MSLFISTLSSGSWNVQEPLSSVICGEGASSLRGSMPHIGSEDGVVDGKYATWTIFGAYPVKRKHPWSAVIHAALSCVWASVAVVGLIICCLFDYVSFKSATSLITQFVDFALCIPLQSSETGSPECISILMHSLLSYSFVSETIAFPQCAAFATLREKVECRRSSSIIQVKF